MKKTAKKSSAKKPTKKTTAKKPATKAPTPRRASLRGFDSLSDINLLLHVANDEHLAKVYLPDAVDRIQAAIAGVSAELRSVERLAAKASEFEEKMAELDLKITGQEGRIAEYEERLGIQDAAAEVEIEIQTGADETAETVPDDDEGDEIEDDNDNEIPDDDSDDDGTSGLTFPKTEEEREIQADFDASDNDEPVSEPTDHF